jgi:predicted aminopeptidase
VELSISNKILAVVFVSLFSIFMSGCSSLYFFFQAGKGQLALLNHGKAIEEVVKDPTTDPKLIPLLNRIGDMKIFGNQYGLKPTPNYTEYVKLDRDSVVYVVTVCDPLEFKVKIFSFPIAGSFNYIGWFKKEDAVDFAKKFQLEGLDIDVRGASAYSTLGWFRDPLLSSMIPRVDGIIQSDALGDLVNVVLHESVHATIYLKDQSYFNESIAVFVADQLTKKYFESNQMLESTEWKSYLDGKVRGDKIRKRMMKAYQDLKAFYDSSMSDSEKKEKKRVYLESLQKEVGFKRPISNATIVQFQTYDDSDHGFQELLDREKGDLKSFLKTLSKLKSSDFKKPHDEKFNLSGFGK